jgi:hypothetical protein
MNKIFFLILTFVGVNVFSQSHKAGTLSFQLNGDLGAHRTVSQTKVFGISSASDTSGAATVITNISGSYSILPWLSAGLTLGTGRYVEDEEQTDNANRISMIGLTLRLYPVNNEKFNWYGAFDLGTTGLEINRKIIFNQDAQYKFRSGHLGVYTGINWYFANFIGLNTQLGLSSHNFNLREFNINNNAQNLNNIESTLGTLGLHFRLGLSFKIN